MLSTLTYETVATWSQVTSLLMFIAMFICVLFYALRPRNGARFEAIQNDALDLKPTKSADRSNP